MLLCTTSCLLSPSVCENCVEMLAHRPGALEGRAAPLTNQGSAGEGEGAGGADGVTWGPVFGALRKAPLRKPVTN